jgi:GT2 family glycosyltransferase/ADP-heptose:LPS heptosyltransferase
MILEKGQVKNKILVIIVSWNQRDDSLRCLESVRRLDYKEYDILFIDNGSLDGTPDVVRQSFPGIFMIGLRTNIGAAAGRNIGIRFARENGYEYIFFLDNDAIVDPPALTELLRSAESSPLVAGVGAKSYYLNVPRKIWNFGGRLNYLKGLFSDTYQGIVDDGQFEQIKEVDSFPIGFGLIKTEAIKRIGEIDERYHIYYEEADWNIRMRKAGFRLLVNPRAKIWHNRSSSLGMESGNFYYYRTRNHLLFVRKNIPWFFQPTAYAYFLLNYFYHGLLTSYLSKRPEQVRATVIGVLDFMRGEFGKRDLSQGSLSRPIYKTAALKLDKIIRTLYEDCVRGLRCSFKRLTGMKLKILVDLDWNLGDEIMAIPVYKAIKERCPNSLLCASVKSPELLEGNPFIDRINQKTDGFDKVFYLKGEDKTINRLDYLSQRSGLSITDRNAKIYLGDLEIAKARLLLAGLTGQVKVAISTGANWDSRQWGESNFKKLAEIIQDKYKAQIIELGKGCQSIGIGLSLIDKTSLRQAAAILSQCCLLICNDSGLAHLSMAVGTPAVVLFGPVAPRNRVLAPDNFYPIYSNADCRGCWSDGRMSYPDICPKGLPDCMEKITLNGVILTIDKVLADKSSFKNEKITCLL